MTAASIREYAAAIRKRYLTSTKKEKSRLLNEFCTVTGYHRKAAVRPLRRPKGGGNRRGRQSQYGLPVAHALKRVWEASDRLCSKRLAPFLPDMVAAMERHGELSLETAVRELLLKVRPSTACCAPIDAAASDAPAVHIALLPVSKPRSLYVPSVNGRTSSQAPFRPTWCCIVEKAPKGST